MAPDVNKIFDWGILGCGWLGRAWALDRIQAGESVWGSARRTRILSELEADGIHPVAFDASLEANAVWPRCRHLLVALPPSAGEQAFQKAAAFSNDCDWTVLISSTSVYPDGDTHGRRRREKDQPPLRCMPSRCRVPFQCGRDHHSTGRRPLWSWATPRRFPPEPGPHEPR